MSKRRNAGVALAMAIVLVIAGIPFIDVSATSTLDKLNQAQQEKAQTEQEKIQSEQERAQVENELGELSQQQGTLKQQLDILNGEMADTAEKLNELENQISTKEEEIAQTQLELEQAREIQDQQYAAMKKRIQFMYEKQDQAYINLIFSAESLSDILNAADYINMIAAYDDKMLAKYTEAREEVEAQEALLQTELENLDLLKEQTVSEQERLSSLVQTVANNVAAYAEQIDGVEDELSSIESEIAAKEQEIAQQEADIAALRQQYESELAMSKLAAQSTHRDISEVVFEEGDRYLLANLIYCEAGGEPYEGKLAVGSVVINRVLSSIYPSTLTGVIYQNRQFSPVGNGKLALALAENRATAACYQAADEAMAGSTNVGNCVYFRTPIEGLTGISIGGHIFY